MPISYPMITTYTQHAHLLSILTHYECAHSWIFNNYIQLYINKDYKHNWGDFYFPLTYELRPSDACKWITTQKIHRNTVTSKWGSVIDFIIENINSNHYVHTMVNYFYVPLSERYNRLHLHHDIFVYGYDLNRELLYVSDFFKKGVYSQAELSFADFDLAFSTDHLTTNHDYLREMVYLYKFNDTYQDNFSIDTMLNSIRCYFANKTPEYWEMFNYGGDRDNLDFGMQIYTTLINYVKDTSDNESKLDVRPFHLLYDHKRIMTLRLKYLYDNRLLSKLVQEHIDEFLSIEVKAKIMMNLVLKYNLTRDLSILEGLRTMIIKIENEEIKFLDHWLKRVCVQ
ncbi:hypothetical protein DFQ01_1155 [Paenibacillus cellulosilyticus]|uniref:Uncharacterized protein n=1 Tax=Paenibacillus cellulosilyticus TaxID=375489 RepID=A0A2V2YSX6_9BACL|nr:hypothetical protein DFQ01_1155 [Paenibacillus cellulosilyticus]